MAGLFSFEKIVILNINVVTYYKTGNIQPVTCPYPEPHATNLRRPRLFILQSKLMVVYFQF